MRFCISLWTREVVLAITVLGFETSCFKVRSTVPWGACCALALLLPSLEDAERLDKEHDWDANENNDKQSKADCCLRLSFSE